MFIYVQIGMYIYIYIYSVCVCVCIDLYSYISGGMPRVAAMTAFASQNNKMQPASLQDSSSVDELAQDPEEEGVCLGKHALSLLA